MPQLVKKRRSGWAVLAAGALVASLLAAGASPAGAAPQTTDEPAGTSACVGDALVDNMFSDVSEDHAFREEINCVAYYGITAGTGDGSTYSPNDNVTRAQMAVFVARAAKVAGVNLASGSGGFSDIGDIWQEAQDAINGLAASGIIPSGGDFMPDDEITRAEMAGFLIGLLNEGAPNVTIDEDGMILLGTGGSAEQGDDYFADSRAAVPRSIDDQISALWELGVTKGASAIGGGTPPPQVLVTTLTYAMLFQENGDRFRNPQGASIVSTVPLRLDDDGKATFSASGLTDIAPAVESDKYEVDVRIQHYRVGAQGATANPPLPANYEPHGTVTRGAMAAFITRALGHTSVRPEGVSAQYDDGVVVSVRDENFQPVANSVVDVFRVDTAGVDLAFRGDGTCDEVSQVDPAATTGYVCEVDGTDFITGSAGDTTVPLAEVDTGGTTVWVWTGDDEDTVDEDTTLYRLDIGEDEVKKGVAQISVSTEFGGEKAHLGSSVLFTVQAEDADGNAVSGYKSDLPFVDGEGEALPEFGTATMQYVAKDMATDDSGDPVIFSTEDGILDASDIKVKVEPAEEFVLVDERGANNRATVTVTDQYGDPISGVQVQLSSADLDSDNDETVIASDRFLTVNSDGTYPFGYERDGEVSTTETLTAVIASFDHDGDDATPALVPDTTADPMVASGTATVQWAVVATASQNAVQQIRAFDTEMNTIFVGEDASVVLVAYDSNDRFNIDRPAEDGGDDPPDAAATFAEFERELSKNDGYTLTWEINGRGSRATNVWSLIVPAAS